MTIDLSKIEEAARAATEGEWTTKWHDSRRCSVYAREHALVAKIAVTNLNRDANAQHIANMDPATVLKLCEAVRAAQAALPQLDYPGPSWHEGRKPAADALREALKDIHL